MAVHVFTRVFPALLLREINDRSLQPESALPSHMVKRSKKRVARKNDQTDVTMLREKVTTFNGMFDPNVHPLSLCYQNSGFFLETLYPLITRKNGGKKGNGTVKKVGRQLLPSC